jgi:hypothetical protein
MASIRWYMDEHVPRAVTAGLLRRGIEVETTQSRGMLGATDNDQLQVAAHHVFVIFTQDDDFLVFASRGVEHAGIVYAPQGTSIGDMVRGLLLITEIYTAEEMIGRIEFI